MYKQNKLFLKDNFTGFMAGFSELQVQLGVKCAADGEWAAIGLETGILVVLLIDLQ
jgi:hypothetical protein